MPRFAETQKIQSQLDAKEKWLHIATRRHSADMKSSPLRAILLRIKLRNSDDADVKDARCVNAFQIASGSDVVLVAIHTGFYAPKQLWLLYQRLLS